MINKLSAHIIIILILLCLRLQAQFSIGPGGWVTIKEGSSLMIGTDLHIKSVAGSSGYLVDQTVDGDVTVTGDITVDRYLTPDVWHNVASPVSNEYSTVYAGTDLVFWYNESLILNDWNFGWVWYYGATGGPLIVFRGYDVLFYTNPVTVNYQANGAETLNTGPYSITVINTASNPTEIPAHKGWNLAGNPYPSPVDWLASSGWNKASINDAKYIWDGDNDIYTIFLGGSAPMGINDGTRFIPSNQGFWVQAVVASGSFGISNATRIGDITGTPDFYKLAPIDYPMVSLWAEGYGHSDEAVVRFIEGTSGGFDLNYDASKLFSLNPDVPQLSIRNGHQTFAVNTFPEITENLAVTLGFRCAAAGNYSIRLAARSTLHPDTKLYLRDELLDKVIDLKSDSTYQFYHHPANPENRFTLYFNPWEDVIGNLSADDWFSVYSNGSTINIHRNTNRELSGLITVYNITGQPVWQQHITDKDRSIIQLTGPSGYYVVNILTEGHVSNTKVLIVN